MGKRRNIQANFSPALPCDCGVIALLLHGLLACNIQ
jgi:hypothetical protein